MKIFYFLIFFALSVQSDAEDIDNAVVERVMLATNLPNKVYVKLDRHQNSPIACHTNTSWEYVIDASTETGKFMYSSILTLYASGKKAKFSGVGNCDVHPNIDTLRRLELK